MNLRDTLEKILLEWVAATKDPFRKHPTAKFFREELKAQVSEIAHNINEDFIIKASPGSGNWANIPWVSVLDPDITTSTTSGVYPVYLFCADGSGVYLSLNQGVTVLNNQYGHVGMRERTSDVAKYLQTHFTNMTTWTTASLNLKPETDLGRSYEEPTVLAKYYAAKALPSNKELEADLIELLQAYGEVKKLYPQIQDIYALNQPNQNELIGKGDALRKPDILINTTPLPKPFILLAGISGTGKSRFVRRQAEVVPANDNFCMVPVRPDWHEPSDLLGYTTRLSGAVEYVATDVLRFVVRAWKVLKDKGFSLSGDAGVTILEGDENTLRHVAPMRLCLDEMNLAPVEQYFADYLSILETRRWDWTNDSFTYRSDALLGPTQLQELRANADGIERLTRYLGLDVEGDDAALWALFLDVGIAIPPQLIVAGTVNMDETTHGFSRKVLDRALTFDFGEFFPNVFEDFFEQSIEAKVFGFPLHSHVTLNALSTCEADPNGNKSISFLKALNRVLKGSPFELAYRALNELLLTVVSYQPTNDIELQAVWDDFLMLKVLPRMEGDADKLQYKQQDRSLLSDVRTVLRQQLSGIWNEDAKRLDYHRTMHGNALDISCRSRVKLQWMEERLRTVGFTSFWP